MRPNQKDIKKDPYTFNSIDENLTVFHIITIPKETLPSVYKWLLHKKKGHGVYKGEVKVFLFSKFPSC